MPRIVFALLCLLAPLPLAAKPTFGVKATPAWVRPVEVAADAGAQGEGGAAFLLYDGQYRATAGRTERYFRRVRRVASSAELESAANIELGFEPSYQELFIHHIRVLRDGQAVDALRPREIRVVQKEEELSSRLYNGELTALAFLDDVRVGDVIDYAYSVNGDNPVLGGRFAEVLYLSEFQSVARLRHRLLWPAGRALHFRADGVELQPSQQNLGAETEYVWERRDVPKLVTEGQLPTWHNPYPQVQLSDFADWGDVARWAVPLYAGQARLSPALAEQIARWKAAHVLSGGAPSDASPVNEAAVLAALRFVQDDVRYLGIELGPYSHQPTAPPAVFERRFGDCKDKSLLLATILGEFGIEAYPALANVDRGRALRRWQPSPFAFDHVIVKAVIGGKVYWFDPTISHQRGSLSRRYNPPYGFALVIKDGSTELEEIPQPDAGAAAEPTTVIREFYRASSYTAPVLLEVVTTYLGPDADDVRADYAGRPRQEIAEDLIDSYAETEPGVEAEGLPQIEDDEEANRIVVTEKYRIADFWRDKERRVYAGHLRQTLGRLRPTSRRRAPLALTYPLGVSQAIELEMPEPVLARRDGGRVTGDAVSFDYRYAREGRTVRLEYKFHTLADGVAPERLASHLDALDKIEHALSYSLTRGAPLLRAGDAALVLGGVMVLLVVFAVPVAVIAVIIVRKRRRERREQQSAAAAQQQPAPPAPGSTPEAAIDLGHAAEIERYVSGLRCECGNLLRQPGETLKSEGLIFDGRRLVNVALKCSRCGAQRDLYFVRLQLREGASLGNAEYNES
jgi:hypothetical protein